MEVEAVAVVEENKPKFRPWDLNRDGKNISYDLGLSDGLDGHEYGLIRSTPASTATGPATAALAPRNELEAAKREE